MMMITSGDDGTTATFIVATTIPPGAGLMISRGAPTNAATKTARVVVNLCLRS